MRNSTIIAVLLFCIAIPRTAAQTPPPSFAKGFELLNKLGPQQPAKETPWRRLPADRPSGNQLLDELAEKMQGNGWLLPPASEGKIRTLHFAQATPSESAPDEAQSPGPGLLGKMLGNSDKETDAEPESLPDLKKDVATIIKTIAKLREDDPDEFSDPESFSRPWNENGASAFGPLLLFASQVHLNGHPDLADQLAWALFNAAPSRESVVDAALNHLGDQLYQDAATRFFASWDWKSYHDDLTKLVTNLPRGWQAQPAAALVLESLSPRVAGKPAPDPANSPAKPDPDAIAATAWMLETPKTNQPEAELPPEVIARLRTIPAEYHAQFLEAMAIQGQGSNLTPPDLWLLQKPEQLAADTSPNAPLLKLGIRALPVLAALATDSYPIAYRNPSPSSRSYSSSDSPFERALQIHASMSRPATRGDIARLILLATLPDPNNDLASVDAETLRDLAIDFHNTHKEKTWSQLAAVFLAEGSATQRSESAKLLASSTDPEHHQFFEKLILESGSTATGIDSVLIYAQQRKAAAKPFIDRYITLLREEFGDGSDLEDNYDIPWEIRQPGRLKTIIKQLESLASGQSAQASAREIARGSPEDAKTAAPDLFQSIPEDKPLARMGAMLAGAVAANDPGIRTLFITLALRISWPTSDDPDSKPRNFTESEASAWQKLLNDKRPIPEEYLNFTRLGETIAELASCAAEYSIAPREYNELHVASIILKKTTPELCSARITARFAKQPIPPIPDPEKISDEQLALIISTAAAKPAAEIPAYLASLTPDESAAWYHWITDSQDPPVPDSVKKLSMTILEEDTTAHSGIKPEPGLLNLKLNTEIHEDTFDSYLATLAADAPRQSPALATLSAADFPPGLSAWVVRPPFPEPKPQNNNEEDPLERLRNPSESIALEIFSDEIDLFKLEGAPANANAIITIDFYTEEDSTTSVWWIIDGKPVLFEISEEDTETNFKSDPESRIKPMIAATREAGTDFQIRIKLITRADAERIAASQPTDEEEE